MRWVIVEANVAHFKDRLEQKTDPKIKETPQKLLGEEKAKLAEYQKRHPRLNAPKLAASLISAKRATSNRCSDRLTRLKDQINLTRKSIAENMERIEAGDDTSDHWVSLVTLEATLGSLEGDLARFKDNEPSK